ncbi:copper-transporting ATPase [bacterium]|nr:MAG: copper-transporting ATPase [bacterium]
MSERTLQVNGMTCEGCEASVSRILAAINGVEEVRASAPAGTVTVELSEDVPDEMLRAAVEGAGFSVAGD